MMKTNALRKKLILFSNNDFKFKQWSKVLRADHNFKCFASKEGLLIIGLIPLLFRPADERVVVFRYLNDRKSVVKSLLFLISDFLTCVVCHLFRIKILWILHNIDKESSANYPRMIQLRRGMVARQAKKIFVTDKVLLKVAKGYLPSHKNKIDYISFGRYSPGMITRRVQDSSHYKDFEKLNFSLATFEELIEIIKQLRKDYELVAFCGGRYSKKRTNFIELPRLMSEAQRADIGLMTIVVSDISAEDDKELFDYFSSNKNILFVNNLLEMDEYLFQDIIDFYWSGYSDISIPYTVYTAASIEVPILSCSSGILPKFLSEYNIGEVISADFANLRSSLIRVQDRSVFDFSSFLKSHSWEGAALKLSE